MKSKIFGALVVASLAGTAMAESPKKAKGAAKKDAAKAGEGWCKSNACGASVEGAKNACKGQMACAGLTKEACEKDAKGTWSTDAKPAAAKPAAAPAKK